MNRPLLALLLVIAACADEPALAPDAARDAGERAPDAEPDALAPDALAPDAEPDVGVAQRVLPERPWEVAERGPYSIGVRALSFVYAERPHQRPRAIEAVVWYPSLDAEGAGATYLDGLFNVAEPDVFAEASLAPAPDSFPILLFSHGNGGFAEQSYFLTEHFASHGWVVVAPTHAGNAVNDGGLGFNYYSVVQRPQDMSALIDALAALKQDDPLAGRLDLDSIAMSGHSYGALTSLLIAGAQIQLDDLRASCAAGRRDRWAGFCTLLEGSGLELARQGFTDDRVKLIIAQAPGLGEAFGESIDAITVPTLMMSSGRDRLLPPETNADQFWPLLPPRSLRFEFPQGGHFTYSNMCEFFATVPQIAEDGCDETFIPYQTALPIIAHYSLAFASFHLLGDRRHAELVGAIERPYADALVQVEAR